MLKIKKRNYVISLYFSCTLVRRKEKLFSFSKKRKLLNIPLHWFEIKD